MALYGCSKEQWLKGFLNLPNGIPSHDTFRRVFMLIDPKAFEKAFTTWARSLSMPLEREIVAIDGETVRGSFDRSREQGPLHIVSAWACEQGLSLGQVQVHAKSNEITAIPELLDALILDNSIVTLDAMGCQRTKTCFGTGAKARPVCDAFDDSHGRLVRRRVFVCPEAAVLVPLAEWPGLKTVLAVESIRSVNNAGKIETDICYFLSSCQDAPEVIAKAIRQHWKIENSLHWVLDVSFREDDCRVRECTAVRNFSLLRKIAINLISRHQKSRNSLRGRRKMAAWDNEYMKQILTGFFHV